MKREVVMPKLNPDMKSGVLCAWLKDEGDSVKKGEPLFEVEANKVVMQVPAESDGVLKRLTADEGDEVAVNERIAEMETSL